MADEATYDDPGQEVECAGSNFVPALANVLTHLVKASERPQQTVTTRFHSAYVPAMSIHDFLMRIARYFQCSSECFVLCLIYIDRIVMLHPGFPVCRLSIHKLILTAAMLAVKFFDDIYYSNAYYAKVGGVKPKEINLLETQFLRLIDWRLHVTPEQYGQYRNNVYMALEGAGKPEAGLTPAVVPNDDQDNSPTET
eukprot:TRINITY_DN2011_c0_g2_i1.p1 TRINITY_DN2011_c0_g2~~TRINITY_DN2011_c0_g2_i1.p1  ORF type:complete len:196 (-),score=25.58 TRINITY_DN2011_c0_g2_i1:93-680(-)